MAVFICIFFNIMKPLSGNFMKPCTHIHIDGANIMKKKIDKKKKTQSKNMTTFMETINCYENGACFGLKSNPD